jgi:hypothetical protein
MRQEWAASPSVGGWRHRRELTLRFHELSDEAFKIVSNRYAATLCCFLDLRSCLRGDAPLKEHGGRAVRTTGAVLQCTHIGMMPEGMHTRDARRRVVLGEAFATAPIRRLVRLKKIAAVISERSLWRFDQACRSRAPG